MNERAEQSELVRTLREYNTSLERQLNAEREARRRADTIIVQLTQATATLAARVPELAAPPEAPEAPEAPETATEMPMGAIPQRRAKPLREVKSAGRADVCWSADEEEYIVDEKTLQFLMVLREQVRDKDSRDVYTGDAARELGIEPGEPEYEIRLAELLRAGYLLPNADQNLTAQGAHQITDEGIAAADES
jgi:hypothetical protein